MLRGGTIKVNEREIKAQFRFKNSHMQFSQLKRESVEGV